MNIPRPVAPDQLDQRVIFGRAFALASQANPSRGTKHKRYNESMKKYLKLILPLIVALILAIGFGFYRHNIQNKNCERGMTGECLPKGMCVAPNDAIVSCEVLRKNPTKTDWL